MLDRQGIAEHAVLDEFPKKWEVFAYAEDKKRSDMAKVIFGEKSF